MSDSTINATHANMHGDISDDHRTVLFGILADIETFGELDEATRESDAFESVRTNGIRYQPAEWLGRRLTLAERKAFSRATRRLEELGLIERIFEPQRARVASVRPTADGATRAKCGRRISFLCRACNLLPNAMQVPMPAGGQATKWANIRNVDVQHYAGPVHSLDVARYQHYIADGIITHNCFYGWRSGAAHKYFGPNNATDLWHVKKVNPQSMVHLTEKPVELAVRAIQYSSKPGENVLAEFIQ